MSQQLTSETLIKTLEVLARLFLPHNPIRIVHAVALTLMSES
jgi:hypothetical protein